MANRKYRGSPRYGGLAEPTNVYDLMEDISLSRMRAKPELQTGFDYSQLDEKFPVRSIAGRVQIERQREEEEPFLEEDLEYRKMQLANKAAELGIKKTARDLDLFEAQINKEDAMLEQIPAARSRFAQLDPRDPEYMAKRMDVIQEFPLAFENERFLKTIDEPLLNRHLRMKQGRVESGKEVTEDAFNKASLLLSESGLKKRVKDGDPIATMQARVAYDTVNKFMAQRGFGAPSAEPTGMAPEMETEEPEAYEFNSLEEADSSGLPVGTIIYINGRKAIIE
jgi:hypothetical protein